MRLIVLACAATVAGCLHAQTPPTKTAAPDPAVLSEFSRLIDDPRRAEEAQLYAERHHLSREATAAPVAAEYARLMRLEAYAEAAEVAWRFKLDQTAIDVPAAFQRKRAAANAAAFLAHRLDPDSKDLRLVAESDLRDEALIGCFFSSRPLDGERAVEDAIAFRAASLFDDDVLFPLLSARCPVDAKWRALIIDLAYARAMDDYAIKYAAESDWLPEQKTRFVWTYFSVPRCSAGFRAVAALRIPPIDVVPMMEKSECEATPILTKGWTMAPADARLYFFAAVRGGKYNMALTLLPFGDFDDNGRTFLFQEALRTGHGGDLVKLLAYHAGYHDALMQYAYDQGRYRFVGSYAQTYDWQRKAFDKLIELGQYDFAGEVAQYGVSETLRTEGIVLAFQAAMKAGNLKAGRYFVARYGPTAKSAGLVTQAMYDQAEKDYIAANPIVTPTAPAKPRPQKKKPPERPPCPKGDWCVGDGK